MSTVEPTCADLHCTTSPNCSIASSCPLIKDRGTIIWTAIADRLDMILVAFTGLGIAVCAAAIVQGGHGEPAAVSLATMLGGMGMGILAYFRLKAGQTVTAKSLERVEQKTDVAAINATTAKQLAATLAEKQDSIALDAKAAKVASRVAVKQNVDLLEKTEELHVVANGKAAAVDKAHGEGIRETIAEVAKVNPEVAQTITAKLLDSGSKF